MPSIRAVLLRDWDPIHINDVPEAQDEYDNYLPGIYRMLVEGADAYRISHHLLQIAEDRAG